MRFEGRLACRRTDGPACITLVGRDERGAAVHLALVGRVPPDLPDRIDIGSIEALAVGRYRVSDGRRTWSLDARGYRHDDVAAAFYAAVPPRAPPRATRLFWYLVLALAASPPGRWWLKHTSR
jgi:hypothetical protein